MNKNKSTRKLIKEFCIEHDFYFSDHESEINLRKMETSLKNGAAVDSKMLAGEEAEDFAVFLQDMDNLSLERAKSEILEHIPEENQYRLYFIVLLADTFERKVKLSKWGKEIREAVKKKIRCGLSVIRYQVLNYYSECQEKFVIDIQNRQNRIAMSGEEDAGEGSIAKKVKAYVYTASLYDIVQMYNKVGDELFQRNVRYSIGEQLDVEKNMKKTLRENPEDFWYLNNGITIIIQNETAFDYSKKSRICLDYKSPGIISVINGAQTISTAAEFWYQDTGAADPQQDDILRQNAQKQAKVLLRIMCVSNGREKCQEELDKISISLNRQKPIRSEDIAYTSPVILEINQLYYADKVDDIHFRITKRGEKGSGKYQYNLTEFARAVKAYRTQKPGEARTLATNQILDYKREDSVYVNRILEQDTEKVFNECYRPINFVMRALAYYKEAGRRISGNLEEIEESVLGNGRYYFAAYLVHVLHEDTEDFTDFAGKIENLNEDFDTILKEYLFVLKRIIWEYMKENGEKMIDSNTFKKDKLYQKLCSYNEIGQDEVLRQDVQKLEEEIRKSLLPDVQ